MKWATSAVRKEADLPPGTGPSLGNGVGHGEDVVVEPGLSGHGVALTSELTGPELAAAMRQAPRRPGRDAGRRTLNITVALIGIILTAPAMLIIAALIRLTSPGPAIFRQARIGIDRRSTGLAGKGERRKFDQGGRVFTIFKFRTMYWAASDSQVWASPKDPRITPFGRILRAYRLDEHWQERSAE